MPRSWPMKKRLATIVISICILILIVFILFLRGTSRSGHKLRFVITEVYKVERQYGQQISVPLMNSGPAPATIRVTCDPPPDLMSGLVGRDSLDWYEEQAVILEPGETRDFPFIIHAATAQKEEYKIAVHALVKDSDGSWIQATNGVVKVEVETPQLNLKTDWREPDNPADHARLVKVLAIRNLGAQVVDLTIIPDDVLEGNVSLSPLHDVFVLNENEEIKMRVIPRLYPGFKELSGTFRIRGHGQELGVPYEVAVLYGGELRFAITEVYKVERQYDQRISVPLMNSGSSPATVRVTCDPPPDLMSGFVGHGSVDWYEEQTVTLGSGETWNFPFIIHAATAQKRNYKVAVHALVKDSDRSWIQAANGIVEVEVETPQLNLKTDWREPDNPADRARLVKVLTIRNLGAQVADLTIMPDDTLEGNVRLSPLYDAFVLNENQEIEMRVIPRLYPGFRELSGAFRIRGQGQELRVSYEVAVPSAKKVFVTTSRCIGEKCAFGQRCTNRRAVEYQMPSVHGTSRGENDFPRINDTEEEQKRGAPKIEVNPLFLNFDKVEEGAHKAVTKTLTIKNIGTDTLVVNSITFDDASFMVDLRKSFSLEPGETRDVSVTCMLEVFEIFEAALTIDSNAGTLEVPLGVNLGWEEVGGENGATDHRAVSSQSPPNVEHLADNIRNMTEGIQQDTIPPEATGSDRTGMTPSTRLGRPTLRDSEANTWEKVIRRDGENIDMLVNDPYSYVPLSGPVRERYTPIKLSDQGNLRHPALSQSPDGSPMAAYVRDTDESGSEIEVVAIGADKHSRLSVPGQKISHPVLIPGAGKTDVVFIEDGKVRRTSIKADLSSTPVETIFEGVDDDAFLRACRLPDSRLAILSRKDRQLILIEEDGESISFPGIHGDLAIGNDGKLHIVIQQADGSIAEYISSEGKAIPLSPAGWDTGPPSLLNTRTGLRLMFHRNLTTTPKDEPGGTFVRNYENGKWGPLELSYQVEEPVEEAFVSLNFSLPWHSAHYKPMNTEIYLNGVLIGRLRERIPNGRFVFWVPARLLKLQSTSGLDSDLNRVYMKVQGIGPGSFHIVDICKIYTRHSLIQESLVASSWEEANQLAMLSTPEIRHNSSDLILHSNYWEAPRTASPGEIIEALVGYVNIGDSPVSTGQIIATAAEKVIGSVSLPEIPPFVKGRIKVPVKLPDDWDVKKTMVFEIKAEVPNDAVPENNSLSFGIFGQPDPVLTEPAPPPESEAARTKGRLRLVAKDALGNAIKPYVSISRAGEQGESAYSYAGSSIDLPPGSYDVSFRYTSYTPPIVYRGVVIEQGQEEEVVAESGYGRLQLAAKDALGDVIKPRVSISRAGEEGEFAYSYAGSYIDLPPRVYDVSFSDPSYAPPIVRRGVVIRRGQVTTVEVGDYGRLQLAAMDALGDAIKLPVSITRAGEEGELASSHAGRYIDLPPDSYDVSFHYDTLYMSFPPPIVRRGVVIEQGQVTTVVAAYGGLRLAAKDASGNVINSRMSISRAGEEGEFAASYTYTGSYIDLPPGSYDVSFFSSYTSSDRLPMVHRGVVIKPGQVMTIQAGYGRLQLIAKDALGDAIKPRVSITRAGEEDEFASSSAGRSIDLPPGRYDVSFSDPSYAPPMVYRGVVIESGQVTTVVAESDYGRLQVAVKDALGDAIYPLMSIGRAGEEAEFTYSSGYSDGNSRYIDLPSGRYDVSFVAYTPPVVHRGVVIEKGQVTTIEAEGDYGRLQLTAKDALGDAIYPLMSISRAGEEAEFASKAGYSHGSSRYIDLPPGRYDVSFSDPSYAPPMVYRGVVIESGQVTTVVAESDYGRLQVAVKDALDDVIYPSMAINRAGEEIVFAYRLSRSYIDLPPGRYDVSFASGRAAMSYAPPTVYRGIVIKPGQVTTIETDGYGTLQLEVKDALGNAIEPGASISHAGEEDEFAYIYDGSSIDLPPGGYDISFSYTLYTPPVVHRGVVVKQGQVTTIEAESGYGRLQLAAKDALDSAIDTGVLIHSVGEEQQFAAHISADHFSYIDYIDLPPGRYDVVFTPDIVHRGVVIKPGQVTTIGSTGTEDSR